MPNNPRKEARVAAREVRQDERRGKRQEKKYDSFLKQGDKEKMKLEKKYSPAQIKQIIDETPPGMRPPWMSSYSTPTTMKRGGATKKYMAGGMKKPLRKANNGTTVGSTTPAPAATPATTPPAGPRDPRMTISSGASAPQPYSVDTPTYGGKPLTQTQVDNLNKKARIDRAMGRSKYGGAKTKFMTGGMVNSNAKVSALKSAGSKGVKSGVNPKAKASTTAKGKTGGTSKAPTKATPTKNKRK